MSCDADLSGDLLAVTIGDPAGVGPEIVAKWLVVRPALAGRVAVIGPAGWLKELPLRDGDRAVAVGRKDFVLRAGMPSAEGAKVALEAMEVAAAGCRGGEFSGVVTGPVSKAELAAVGYPYPGQTEFFAARWGGVPVMGFCGGKLRVVLLTWHIPFVKVPSELTEGNFERAILAAMELCRAEGVELPKVGVCGLNPHAGEGGLLGMEERDVIDPILERLRGKLKGVVISRTQPSDTVFARSLQGEFDAVVAIYHDQGLAPLKTVEFDEAVNVTLGLPWVRTSPDHGTAFGIAGKGVARVGSFANAVEVARRLIGWRGREVDFSR